jgi:hypothetical protein
MKSRSLRTAVKILVAACGALALQSSAHAAQPACDRACLQGLADKVLDSMVARDPSGLPLTQDYAATENSVPAALNMMTPWRTATAVGGRFYVIDPVSQQLFVMATLSEGPHETLLYGRLKAQDGKIAEIELFENRSRGQGGFQYAGDIAKGMPAEWRAAVGTRVPSRAVLLKEGRSIFNTNIKGLAASNTCVLMENGKVVAEHAEVAKAVAGDMGGPMRAANPDGSVSIPCGSPPFRPTDPKARTDIVDEVQGIVVSQAIVQGETEPYLATTPTESAFVPFAMLAPYSKMLAEQKRSGKFTAPALRPMAASAAVTEVHRVYDGKVQGQLLLVNLGGPGASSPWRQK